MKIALLRAYPKDAALGKMVSILTGKHTVDCLIWDRQRDYEPIVANNRVRYIRCLVSARYYSLATFLKMLLFEGWLFLKLLTVRADLIHAMDLDTGVVALIAARLRGKPLVYQCLDPYYAALPKSWPKFLGRLARHLENLVISRADLFVITDLMRMPQHEGAAPRKVVMLPNVPHRDLVAAARPAGAPFTAGYIGSLVPGRNLDTMVEAAGSLEGEGVRLTVGGFGPLEEAVRARAQQHANVTYTPWIPYDRVLELEAAFDVIVHMTDPENPAQMWASPNKLFESMALGKPMIVAEGTLTARRVAEIGNGLVIPYGSKEALGAALLELMRNPALAREMGERGREAFQREWRFELCARRLHEAYPQARGGGA